MLTGLNAQNMKVSLAPTYFFVVGEEVIKIFRSVAGCDKVLMIFGNMLKLKASSLHEHKGKKSPSNGPPPGFMTKSLLLLPAQVYFCPIAVRSVRHIIHWGRPD